MPSIEINANLSAGSLGDLVRSVQDALGTVDFDALRDAGAENLIADLERLQFQLRGTEQEMTRVAGVAEQLDGGVDLTIDSNADEVSGELEQVDAALDELTGTSANIDIDADTEETLAELNEIDAALDELTGSSANIDVDADTEDALAELTELDSALDTIDGEDITATVEVSGAEESAASLINFDEAAADLADNLANRLPGPLGNVVGLIGQVSPVAAAAAAALGGLLVVGEQFAGASRDISVATGATGEALDDLNGSFETVLSTATAADFSDTSAQIGILNTFLGSTGTELESLAVPLQEVNRLLGEDVVQNSEDFAQVLNLFGIAANEGASELDGLFVATQLYGISLSSLLTQLETSGSLFSSFGLSLGESADLIGQFNRAGLQASQAGQALQQYIRSVSEDSGDLTTALADVQQEILGATTDTEAFTIATEAFGARGGVQFATAIRSGIIDLENLGGALADADGSIQQFAADNELAAETISSAWNDILVTLEPLGTLLRDGTAEGLGIVRDRASETADGLGFLRDGIGALGDALGNINWEGRFPDTIELPTVDPDDLQISQTLDAIPKYVLDVVELPVVDPDDLLISQTLDALPKYNVGVGYEIASDAVAELVASLAQTTSTLGFDEGAGIELQLQLAADQAAIENEIAAFVDPLEATILASFDVDTGEFDAAAFIEERTAELQAAAELEEIVLEIGAELPEEEALAALSILGEIAGEFGPEAAADFWAEFSDGADPSEFLTDPLLGAFDGASTEAGQLLYEGAQTALDAGLEAEVDFIEGPQPTLDDLTVTVTPDLGPLPAFPTTPFPVVPEFGAFPNIPPLNVPVNPILGAINPVTDAIPFPVIPEFGPFPALPPTDVTVNPNPAPLPPYDPTDIEVNPYGYELPPYPPEEVEVNPVLGGDLQAQIDALALQARVSVQFLEANLEEGGAFSLAGIPQFRDGGFVAHGPSLVPLGGTQLGIMGESYRGPETAEYGPNGTAIIGGYHHAQLRRDRLDQVGAWEDLRDKVATQELMARGWQPPPSGAGGPGIGVLAGQLAEVTNQLGAVQDELSALKRSNHRLEESAETNTRANVETSANTRGSRFSKRRERL